MAEKNEAKKVKIRLDRARGSEPKELYVAVNGVNYLVPKGKEVEVPEFVAEEIKRSEAAALFMDEEKERLLAEAK